LYAIRAKVVWFAWPRFSRTLPLMFGLHRGNGCYGSGNRVKSDDFDHKLWDTLLKMSEMLKLFLKWQAGQLRMLRSSSFKALVRARLVEQAWLYLVLPAQHNMLRPRRHSGCGASRKPNRVQYSSLRYGLPTLVTLRHQIGQALWR